MLASLCTAQEWRSYGGDPGGVRHSPLTQIHRGNVAKLKAVWTYHSGDKSDGKDWPQKSAFEGTPLMANGALYLTTSFSRLVKLDPASGAEIWAFDPQIDKTRPNNLFINRGAAYWTNGKQERIFFGTLDGRLFSIDAATGRPAPGFGNEGHVDLKKGATTEEHPGRFGLTSPPAVYGNLVITGSMVSDGEPRGPSGDVRAWDALTGQLKWRFHVIPHKGEYGNDTWSEDAWRNRGGANAWSMLSVDERRGIVFLPLTSPATDFYGGDRKGDNLFGNSLVALDASSGKRLWHFQTVHHDIWDYDLPAQPMLISVARGGATVPAVAQITKTGFVFLFDRVTGKPLFPIEEKPVPKSETPGEASSPTQPVPKLPPPFARQSMKPDELTNFSPASRAFCQELMKDAVLGDLFTPIGLKTTILFPGTNGGANWGGGSYDPATSTLYVNSMDVGMVYQMIQRPEGSVIPYRTRGPKTPNSRFWDPDMNPCQRPPWGHLTAIDMNTGQFRWRVTLGRPGTGSPNIGGSIVTAGGLVFIGATNDSKFRAFDKDNGKELWTADLPASAHATPMTYFDKKTGKQLVVVAAGGGNKYNATVSDSLVAFSLP